MAPAETFSCITYASWLVGGLVKEHDDEFARL